MPTLEIKNIGAIKDVTINTKRFTLIIGPQSSGKSTIAKILSFCAWVEKQILIDENFKESWLDENLLEFHHIESYVRDGSSFHYEGQILSLSYQYGSTLTWKKLENKHNLKPAQIAYIPSERNLVSIPDITGLRLPFNYIRSFLFDWSRIRKKYTKSQPLNILNLNHSYYFSEKKEVDTITVNDIKLDLSIDETSSGLQSLVPLYVMIDYLTNRMKEGKAELSYDQFERAVIRLWTEREQLESKHLNKNKLNLLYNEKFAFLHPKNSHMIIEEPEQNLFPDAQRDLVDYIVKSAGDEHQVLMTTHSPYILLAMNNMLMRSLVKDDIHESEKKALLDGKAMLSADETALYQITKDGQLETIQDEDGLLEENFLNEIYSSQGDEFAALLNYYSYND